MAIDSQDTEEQKEGSVKEFLLSYKGLLILGAIVFVILFRGRLEPLGFDRATFIGIGAIIGMFFLELLHIGLKHRSPKIIFNDGFCLTENNYIREIKGKISIMDSHINNKVLTKNGYKNIEQKFERKYEGEIISIKTNGNFNDLELTPEHKIYVNENNKFLWKQAKELNGKERLVTPLLLEKTIENEEINENKAWLIGFYLGDGHISFNTNGVDAQKLNFTLHRTKDLQNKEKIIRIISEEFGINTYNIKESKYNFCDRITFYSCNLAQFMQKYGGNPRHKRIHPDLILANAEIQRNIIHGLMDADGYFTNKTSNMYKKSSLVLSLISKTIMDDISFMLKRLKISYCTDIPKMYPERQKLERFKNYRIHQQYRLSIFNCTKDITQNMINKGHTIKYLDNFALTKIKSIEKKHFNGVVYDISIPEMKEFLANDYIVHNSTTNGEFQVAGNYFIAPLGGIDAFGVKYRGDDGVIVAPITAVSNLGKSFVINVRAKQVTEDLIPHHAFALIRSKKWKKPIYVGYADEKQLHDYVNKKELTKKDKDFMEEHFSGKKYVSVGYLITEVEDLTRTIYMLSSNNEFRTQFIEKMMGSHSRVKQSIIKGEGTLGERARKLLSGDE